MIGKNINKKFLISFFLVLFIYFLDRISKILVIFLDKKFLGSDIFSSKILNINLIWNEGIAFGLFSFNEKFFYNILTTIILIIIIIIIIMLVNSNGFKKYSLLLILGGALGNFSDRIFYQAVPDFIDFHYKDFHWFIFNVADIFISLGVIFLIIIELFDTNKKKEL
tara:strand:+ start:1353 stop:1850 length:498 start_codon:yes stop_codon:yes gene_type:complete